MTIPKGMQKPQVSGKPVIYDIDEDDPSEVNNLPEWIKELVMSSESYQEKINVAGDASAVEFTELDEDDGVIPF